MTTYFFSDPMKAASKGHFISLDGRPVSSIRGLFKDFIKLYKTYYRRWLSIARSTDVSFDPFLCLHLRCPTGSYDVNVEPAKDEVLFTDTIGVRRLLEAFLISVYGDLSENPESAALRADGHGRNSSVPMSQPFELLLSKREHSRSKVIEDVLNLDQSPDFTRQTSIKQQEHDLRRTSSAMETSSEPDHDQDHQSTSKRKLNASARPHRNMYDFEEDDMSISELPSPPEQDSIAKTDRVELRKVSVTNPWAIAKLNALIPSIQSPSFNVDTGHTTEQLMTPGPDPGAVNLVPPRIRSAFVPRTNLPSPARSDSSRSPTYRKNPSPPTRRRALVDQVEDDIEFTQDSTNDDSTPGCSTSSEPSANWKPHKMHPQLSDEPPEMVDMDGRFKSHFNQRADNSENSHIGLQSARSTAPGEGRVETSKTCNAVSKAFISPFKTARRSFALHPPPKITPTISSRSNHQFTTEQSWGSSQSERRSISPASYAATPPLYQSHQHPMASPPYLQPSPPQLSTSFKKTVFTPHPELEEIMDFEHRKKAVNAQHRSQSKLMNKYLNSGQLAQIQRESISSIQTSGDIQPYGNSSRKLPAASLDANDSTQKVYDVGRSIDARYTDLLPPTSQAEASPSPKASPHRNRYLAARAVLTRPESPSRTPGVRPAGALESAYEDSESSEILPSLPEEDPRAYLIQYRKASSLDSNGHGPNAQPGLPRPGLKIKRTKTSKLPFETIPPKLATRNICAKPTSPIPLPNDLKAQSHHLAAVDSYARTGKNDFVVWISNSEDADRWEDEIKRLIRRKYMAKLPDGEKIPANLQLRLSVAFTAHGEEFSQLC